MKLTTALETLIRELASLPRTNINEDEEFAALMLPPGATDVGLFNRELIELSDIYRDALSTALSNYRKVLALTANLSDIDISAEFDNTHKCHYMTTVNILHYLSHKLFNFLDAVSVIDSKFFETGSAELLISASEAIDSAYEHCCKIEDDIMHRYE